MAPMNEGLKEIILLPVYIGLVFGYIAFTNWRTNDYPEGPAAAIFNFPVIAILSLLLAALVKLLAGTSGKEKGIVAFHISFILSFAGLTIVMFPP